jgi:hypothetical protein
LARVIFWVELENDFDITKVHSLPNKDYQNIARQDVRTGIHERALMANMRIGISCMCSIKMAKEFTLLKKRCTEL